MPFSAGEYFDHTGAKYAVYLTIRALINPEMKLSGSHPAGFLTRPSWKPVVCIPVAVI